MPRFTLAPARILRRAACLLAFAALLPSAFAGGADPMRPIAVNQTDGYADEKLVAFTYFMNFSCVHGPFTDLDRDGRTAATDPDEFQSPRCVVGEQSAIDPTGKPVQETEKLWVIVPFFDADRDGEAAAPELAAALNGLFGFVPDAFDPTPGVPVQCPEPGAPLTRHQGEFGTCTMHPTTVDLGPVLAQLGKVPPGNKVVVPTPNHSHIIRGANFGSVWWQIIVVLVTDPAVWPDVEGTRGINSLDALREAQAGGQALGDVASNFFLFFDSRAFPHGRH